MFWKTYPTRRLFQRTLRNTPRKHDFIQNLDRTKSNERFKLHFVVITKRTSSTPLYEVCPVSFSLSLSRHVNDGQSQRLLCVNRGQKARARFSSRLGQFSHTGSGEIVTDGERLLVHRLRLAGVEQIRRHGASVNPLLKISLVQHVNFVHDVISVAKVPTAVAVVNG